MRGGSRKRRRWLKRGEGIPLPCCRDCFVILFLAMTKFAGKCRVVMARDLVIRGHLGFCHYERSEVIQKPMLLESRLRQSLRFFAMTRGVWLV